MFSEFYLFVYVVGRLVIYYSCFNNLEHLPWHCDTEKLGMLIYLDFVMDVRC